MSLSKQVLAIAALLSLTACSSTSPAGNYSRVNELGRTKTAKVQLTSGAEFRADLLRVMADSAYYVQPHTLFPSAVPSNQLAQITFVNRRKGAFTGLRNVLMISGASIIGGFALRSTCDSSNNSQPYIPECAAFAMVIVPIFTAPFTLPGGMLIGAIRGKKEKYRVVRPLQD